MKKDESAAVVMVSRGGKTGTSICGPLEERNSRFSHQNDHQLSNYSTEYPHFQSI